MVVREQGRSYDSSNRRAQALQTRERILTQARRLFIERGFAATSIADVATAARVSTPTVFSAFGTKVNLLKEAAESTIVGDARPVPMAEREAMRHVHAAPTAQEVLDRFAALVAEKAAEIHPIYAVIYSSRDGNPEIAAMADLLDDQRLTGATALARTLLNRLGRDDPELLDEVRDALWVLMSLDWYEAFVIDRGWSPERYRDWLRAAMAIPLASVVSSGSGEVTTSCRT